MNSLTLLLVTVALVGLVSAYPPPPVLQNALSTMIQEVQEARSEARWAGNEVKEQQFPLSQVKEQQDEFETLKQLLNKLMAKEQQGIYAQQQQIEMADVMQYPWEEVKTSNEMFANKLMAKEQQYESETLKQLLNKLMAKEQQAQQQQIEMADVQYPWEEVETSNEMADMQYPPWEEEVETANEMDAANAMNGAQALLKLKKMLKANAQYSPCVCIRSPCPCDHHGKK